MTLRRTLPLAAAAALATLLGLAAVRSALADKPQQPLMHTALHHLQVARNSLEKATNDKGGHRVKALELVRQAIAEVKAGVAYDASN